MNQVYPWQESQWQILYEARQQNRLPHALLLSGPQGLGKLDFARVLAQSLLCDQPGPQGPCGICRYCQLYAAGSHPDYKLIAPPEGKKAIVVDQIRELAGFLALTSQYAQHRVVIISPAEAMNINAANSLLKTLEEPSADTVFILVSHQVARLPATIRSRCQEIRFPVANPELAGQWLASQLSGEQSHSSDLLLALAAYAPLQARALAQGPQMAKRQALFQGLEQLCRLQQSPVALAKQAADKEIAWSLDCLYSWLVDIARLKASPAAAQLSNPDLVDALRWQANTLSLKQILSLQDEWTHARQNLAGNINPTLIMESLLIKWQNCFRAAQRRIA